MDSNKIIRWGIIGCGDVCEVKSGPAFYTCSNSTLQAVMRRNADLAADFAKRHGVPRYYSSVDDLIHDRDVDIVYIATPPGSHAELAIKALQAKKPVYVEKPMGITYKECMLMNQVAKDNNQKLWVAYYRRSLPYFRKVKEILSAGLIGNVLSVRTEFYRPPLDCDLDRMNQTWRVNKEVSGGGYFYDMAPHTIDILMYLLGKIVKANGTVNNTGWLYEVEDTVSASFLFENGVVGSSIWCYVAPALVHEDLIEIIGQTGVLKFSTFQFSPIELILKNEAQTFEIQRPDCVQKNMIQEIVNEMTGGNKASSDGESGAWTNWVIEQIFQ